MEIPVRRRTPLPSNLTKGHGARLRRLWLRAPARPAAPEYPDTCKSRTSSGANSPGVPISSAVQVYPANAFSSLDAGSDDWINTPRHRQALVLLIKCSVIYPLYLNIEQGLPPSNLLRMRVSFSRQRMELRAIGLRARRPQGRRVKKQVQIQTDAYLLTGPIRGRAAGAPYLCASNGTSRETVVVASGHGTQPNRHEWLTSSPPHQRAQHRS